jgi:transposase-like protein
VQPRHQWHAYVLLDGLWRKRSWAGEVKNVSILVAIGVNADGHREVLGVTEGVKEDKAFWQNFLRHLKGRGLKGVRLIVSDRCLGLVESVAEFYPAAAYQRCVVHFYRNVWSLVPSTKSHEVSAMLKAIPSQRRPRRRPDKSRIGGLQTTRNETARRRAIGGNKHRRNV